MVARGSVFLWSNAEPGSYFLSPFSRLTAGAFLLASIIWCSSESPASIAAVGAVFVVWIGLSRVSWRRFGSLLTYSLAVFTPLLLLAPWMDAGTGTQGPVLPETAGTLVWIILRATAGVLVVGATLSTVTRSQLCDFIERLPLPRLVRLILVQIVHQTDTLLRETRRLTAAFQLRQGRGSWRRSVSLIGALTSVWLPRILFKADRVASAMELRGYAVRPLHPERLSLRTRDVLCMAASFFLLLFVLILRMGFSYGIG